MKTEKFELTFSFIFVHFHKPTKFLHYWIQNFKKFFTIPTGFVGQKFY